MSFTNRRDFTQRPERPLYLPPYSAPCRIYPQKISLQNNPVSLKLILKARRQFDWLPDKGRMGSPESPMQCQKEIKGLLGLMPLAKGDPRFAAVSPKYTYKIYKEASGRPLELLFLSHLLAKAEHVSSQLLRCSHMAHQPFAFGLLLIFRLARAVR